MVVADINGADALDCPGARVLEAYAIEVDVSLRDSIEAMVRAVTVSFGHVDILVNNAGVFDMVPPV